MDSIGNISQLKEFLTVYNTLTDRCFGSCVRQFNAHELDESETKCTKLCIDKQMRVNRRFMVVFAELAPTMFNKGPQPLTANGPSPATTPAPESEAATK